MLKVIWRAEARDSYFRIVDYIAEHHPPAADRLGMTLAAYADRLAQFPHMHRPGRIPDTREAVVHPNYILVYRITDDAIEILNLLHTRQRYP